MVLPREAKKVLANLFKAPGHVVAGTSVITVRLDPAANSTARNSIMLISHYEHLVREEGMTWGPEAAVRGASERLVPILMTALVTGIGVIPYARNWGTSAAMILEA